MAKTVRIKVTAEDIARGEADNCYGCPIALAATRAGLIRPAVYSIGIYSGSDGPRVCSTPPREAIRFMYDFDEGEPVSPFAFDLELPDA